MSGQRLNPKRCIEKGSVPRTKTLESLQVNYCLQAFDKRDNAKTLFGEGMVFADN